MRTVRNGARLRSEHTDILPFAILASPTKESITMVQYRHSDAGHSLRDLVQSTLSRSPYFAGRNLRIELHDNDIVLKGVVNTYYQKQLAQESIRNIDGIRRIRNDIEVLTGY